MQECKEGFGDLVIAGSDATELLEAVEHAFDAVPILVAPPEVAGNRLGTV